MFAVSPPAASTLDARPQSGQLKQAFEVPLLPESTKFPLDDLHGIDTAFFDNLPCDFDELPLDIQKAAMSGGFPGGEPPLPPAPFDYSALDIQKAGMSSVFSGGEPPLPPAPFDDSALDIQKAAMSSVFSGGEPPLPPMLFTGGFDWDNPPAFFSNPLAPPIAVEPRRNYLAINTVTTRMHLLASQVTPTNQLIFAAVCIGESPRDIERLFFQGKTVNVMFANIFEYQARTGAVLVNPMTVDDVIRNTMDIYSYTSPPAAPASPPPEPSASAHAATRSTKATRDPGDKRSINSFSEKNNRWKLWFFARKSDRRNWIPSQCGRPGQVDTPMHFSAADAVLTWKRWDFQWIQVPCENSSSVLCVPRRFCLQNVIPSAMEIPVAFHEVVYSLIPANVCNRVSDQAFGAARPTLLNCSTNIPQGIESPYSDTNVNVFNTYAAQIAGSGAIIDMHAVVWINFMVIIGYYPPMKFGKAAFGYVCGLHMKDKNVVLSIYSPDPPSMGQSDKHVHAKCNFDDRVVGYFWEVSWKLEIAQTEVYSLANAPEQLEFFPFSKSMDLSQAGIFP